MPPEVAELSMEDHLVRLYEQDDGCGSDHDEGWPATRAVAKEIAHRKDFSFDRIAAAFGNLTSKLHGDATWVLLDMLFVETKDLTSVIALVARPELQGVLGSYFAHAEKPAFEQAEKLREHIDDFSPCAKAALASFIITVAEGGSLAEDYLLQFAFEELLPQMALEEDTGAFRLRKLICYAWSSQAYGEERTGLPPLKAQDLLPFVKQLGKLAEL